MVPIEPAWQARLYFIETYRPGEGSFTYRPSDSAARRMFALPTSARLEATVSG